MKIAVRYQSRGGKLTDKQIEKIELLANNVLISAKDR